MKKDYLTYSIEDYFNLGIYDAIIEGKSKSEEIKKSLTNVPETKIKKIIEKYNLGYRVGLIRIIFTEIGEDIIIEEPIQKLIQKNRRKQC